MFKITKSGQFKFHKTGTAKKAPAKGTQGGAAVVKKPNTNPDAQKAMVPDPVALVPVRQKKTPRKQGPY